MRATGHTPNVCHSLRELIRFMSVPPAHAGGFMLSLATRAFKRQVLPVSWRVGKLHTRRGPDRQLLPRPCRCHDRLEEVLLLSRHWQENKHRTARARSRVFSWVNYNLNDKRLPQISCIFGQI